MTSHWCRDQSLLPGPVTAAMTSHRCQDQSLVSGPVTGVGTSHCCQDQSLLCPAGGQRGLRLLPVHAVGFDQVTAQIGRPTQTAATDGTAGESLVGAPVLVPRRLGAKRAPADGALEARRVATAGR